MITRTQRTLIVAAAVAAIAVSANASSGAYFSQSWGWVALAFLVPTTVLLILDRVSVPGQLRIAFASLMGGVGVWIALSTVWSISAPGTVREVERVLVYVAFALAVALVLKRGDGPGVFAGMLTGITVVTAYGLATRLLPDRFDAYDDPLNPYRLAEPLGYWNAFGLFTAIGVILVVGAVAHARRSWPAIVAGATAPILVTALYFAFSRGSWLALFLGLAAAVALDSRRVTLLWTLLVLAPPSVAAVAVASRQEAITHEDAPLAAAAREGHRLAWLIAGMIVCSAALGWIAHRFAKRVAIAPGLRLGFAAVLAAGAVGAILVAVAAAGGPVSALEEIRSRFEAEPVSGPGLNNRLFSASGGGRAESIRVAWDSATENPVVGTGAGTFEMVWYERRPAAYAIRDAHSLYAETLAELGFVGLTLLGAALIVPLAAAVRARRSRFVAPACGAYLAWVSASGLDWHWEMVGLTMIAFLAGSVALLAAERRPRGPLHPGSRLALVGLTATLSVLAVWSLVGNQALFAGRDAIEREDWVEARDHARRAQALLFWSQEPDLVRGDAAAGLGDREGALRASREAIEKDPRNWLAWLRLAQVARGVESDAAYDRVHELNPLVKGLPGE